MPWLNNCSAVPTRMRALIHLMLAIASVASIEAQTLDPTEVGSGKKVFETFKCSQCHVVGMKVQGKKKTLDGVGMKRSAAELRQWIVAPAEMELKTTPSMTGVKKMSTAMNGRKMTDADVAALVAYLQSLR